ncbi:MAG TPA: tetratricopeptide repeat protein, partial [Demequina sp.]|nr:tetratricopeptide repeat protein [Demequina sp.]
QRSGDDRPRRPYEGGGDRPQRSYGDRPQRSGDDRPRRPYEGGGDRPQRSYGDRPPRTSDRDRLRQDDRGDRRYDDRGPSVGRPQWEDRHDDSHDRRRVERAAERAAEPPLDDDITPQMLDKESRTHLRTLNKENSDYVARHLVAAGQYLDTDPELAYQHALAAQRRAGRVDVVREAVALTAYQTGRYADALREARTVRRLSGDDSLRAIEADSERGLGRPERALAVIAEVELAHQPAHARTELAIVASGARADLGEFEAGLLVIEDALRFIRDVDLRGRLLSVKADRLDDLKRTEEANEVRAMLEAEPSEDDESVLYIDETLDEELAMAVDLEDAADREREVASDEDADEESDFDEESGEPFNVVGDVDDVREPYGHDSEDDDFDDDADSDEASGEPLKVVGDLDDVREPYGPAEPDGDDVAGGESPEDEMAGDGERDER